MKRALLAALLALIAAALCLWQSDWLAQDRCLDSGCRWTAQGSCQR
ncbi:hypothetical protein [Sphingobium yanoikuyae]|nr:hypothetical protein [Sphingobium yanoikuyae]MDV3482390.1 hypothetical protein [Sphingobium yanoikuyae]